MATKQCFEIEIKIDQKITYFQLVIEIMIDQKQQIILLTNYRTFAMEDLNLYKKT